ncbi:flagellar hook-length control protein FliK [Sediminibacillus albus]|uniref:Flagellar hook-length control protein FliK n=1 Tax=Sediminibacillus albus TaxID=407036 RepID=A0A1G8W249_9BACI|nr:flagellar hook-length control protein FliK [Sediminibacillus albus]SDJ72382.1 flagellar hook-length control protein FliK [Sediminibacillus albus]
MNSAGVLFTQPNASLSQTGKSGSSKASGVALAFKDVLGQTADLENLSSEEKIDLSNALDDLLNALQSFQDGQKEAQSEDGQLILDLLNEIPEELLGKLSELSSDQIMATLAREDQISDSSAQILAALIQQLGGQGSQKPGQGAEEQKSSLESVNHLFPLTNVIAFVKGAEHQGAEMDAKYKNIWQQANLLLSGIQGGSPTKEQETKLLKLLEQWTALEKQSGKTNMVQLTDQSAGKGDNTKQQTVWSQLLTTFRSRSALLSQQRYQSNSAVTGSDVGKWIKQALGKYGEEISGTNNNLSSASMSSMPASKIEQYIVHLNQTGSQEANQKQLMETLQKAIKESSFLKDNGSTQISLKLRPAQLGDIMVKMTQINGEMAVRITVTSQAAKEMLEGNLHQLKHMFSPQQVVIEKQDAQLLQQDSKESEQQGKGDLDESGQEDGYQQDSQQSGDEDDDGESSFSELLMNEKV